MTQGANVRHLIYEQLDDTVLFLVNQSMIEFNSGILNIIGVPGVRSSAYNEGDQRGMKESMHGKEHVQCKASR